MVTHLLVLLALGASAARVQDAPCFGLEEARSAVVLSPQDLLLGVGQGEVLLRTDGACRGLTEAGVVYLRPADGSKRFCGVGDSVETGVARCGVAAMVDVPESAETCFRSDRLRTWTLSALDRLEVRTRDGDFELELAGSCPELSRSDDLRFLSQRSLRQVCGGRNDQVLPLISRGGPDSALAMARSARSASGPGEPLGLQSSSAAIGFACTIRSVRRIAGR